MKPGIDPKVDYVFKKVFGSEEQKNVLVHLLNAVLQPEAGEEVEGVMLMNPFSEKTAEEDKPIVLDIKARDKKGRWFNVEMQLAAPALYAVRVIYYWAKLYAAQLSEGENFEVLRSSVSISFLNSRLFADDAFLHKFTPFDRINNVELSNHFTLYFVELPKFTLTAEELTTPLDAWCYFLIRGESLDTESLPKALDTPPFHQTMELLCIMSQDTREREIYEARLRARRDRAAELQDARNEGRDEGIDQGELMGSVRLSQELLGLPASSREELKALNPVELGALADRLKQLLKSRP